MKNIGTLGPEGTFSDIATKKYINASGNDYEIQYFKSIKSTLIAIGNECEFGILPIENYSEGFVSLVLDTIADSKLFITGEILLPIQFSFVTNANCISNIEKLFVQFVAKNQCSEFIESLGDVEIVTTESNITSLDNAKKNVSSLAGAIVPVNSFSKGDFQFTRGNVNDFCNNQTRFLMFSSKQQYLHRNDDVVYKTSIVVFNDHDRPGLLESILAPFSKRNINLTSITSRPTKKKFGRYNFFIGLEGHLNDKKVNEALIEIGKNNRLNSFGSYPKASQLK
jgi:prephenate dehydratase